MCKYLNMDFKINLIIQHRTKVNYYKRNILKICDSAMKVHLAFGSFIIQYPDFAKLVKQKRLNMYTVGPRVPDVR